MAHKSEKKPKTTIPRSKCVITLGTSASCAEITGKELDTKSGNDTGSSSKKQKVDSLTAVGSSSSQAEPTKDAAKSKHDPVFKNNQTSIKASQKISRLIETHNFAKSAQFTFPSRYLSLIQQKVIQSIPAIYFYRIRCTLGDILFAPGFLSNYVKQNSCLLISETLLDHQDVYAMSNGTLHLSLQPETFRRAGLSNVTFTKPDPRGLGSKSYRLSYDLRSPKSIVGHPAYDRLRWALTNTLVDYDKDVHTFAIVTLDKHGMPLEMDHQLALHFHNLGLKRKDEFEAYDLIPEVKARKDRAVPILKVPQVTYEPANEISAESFKRSINLDTSSEIQSNGSTGGAAPASQKLLPFPKDLAKEVVQEWAFSVTDWLALVSLDSDRTRFVDNLDPHLSSYELLDKDEQGHDLTILELGGGLIPSALIHSVWKRIMDVLCNDTSITETPVDLDFAWAALSVHGVEDTPVSWANKQHIYTSNGGENNYIIVKLPSQDYDDKTLESNLTNAANVVNGLTKPNSTDPARIATGTSNKRLVSDMEDTFENHTPIPTFPFIMFQFLDHADQ